MRIEPVSTMPTATAASTSESRAAEQSAPSKPIIIRNDYLVLSAEAYRALVQAPRMDLQLAGTFTVSAVDAQGRLSIRPGSEEGVVHVEVDLMHVAQWPEPPGPIRHLQLSADLRGSWVHRATASDASPREQAQQLAQAVAALAQIPGQRTVNVTAIPDFAADKADQAAA